MLLGLSKTNKYLIRNAIHRYRVLQFNMHGVEILTFLFNPATEHNAATIRSVRLKVSKNLNRVRTELDQCKIFRSHCCEPDYSCGVGTNLQAWTPERAQLLNPIW